MLELMITGATGFLGRHLMKECFYQSGYALRILSRNPDKITRCDGAVAVCKGDLLDPDSLEGFIRPGGTIIHLAYLPDNVQANLQVARNLIDAAKNTGVARFIHCSTAAVIGFGLPGVVSEDTIPMPEDDYQRMKYSIELMLQDRLLPEIQLGILRPTEIFGPGGRCLKPMIIRLKNGSRLLNEILGFVLCERRFNYISVQNVVRALLLLATTPAALQGDIFFVSDDEDPNNCYADVESIVREALTHKKWNRRRYGIPAWMLPFIFMLLPGHSRPDRVYCCQKISAMGYEPRISLRSAIFELVHWIERA